MKRQPIIFWSTIVVALAVIGLVVLRREQSPSITPRPVPNSSGPREPVSPPRISGSEPLQKRPFAVVREKNNIEWTAENGRDTNVIHRLAHNELEYQRMVDENSRIIQRQLVYCKETIAALVERAKLSGQPIRWLTLPGLDGQEIPFEIARADLSPSGQQGTFAGRIVGRPGSLVTLAFKGGREAFTVISPTENLYLQGDPHEPGEILVKSFDPKTYVAGVCGNP